MFAAPAARDWLRLLEALERPASTLRAKTAALTAFLDKQRDVLVRKIEGVARHAGHADIIRESIDGSTGE